MLLVLLLTNLLLMGSLIMAALIGGLMVLFKVGEKEALWFAIPLLAAGALSLFQQLGVIIWLVVIFVFYLKLKPENGKWSDKKDCYWFNIGVVATIVVYMVVSVISVFILWTYLSPL